MFTIKYLCCYTFSWRFWHLAALNEAVNFQNNDFEHFSLHSFSFHKNNSIRTSWLKFGENFSLSKFTKNSNFEHGNQLWPRQACIRGIFYRSVNYWINLLKIRTTEPGCNEKECILFGKSKILKWRYTDRRKRAEKVISGISYPAITRPFLLPSAYSYRLWYRNYWTTWSNCSNNTTRIQEGKIGRQW